MTSSDLPAKPSVTPFNKSSIGDSLIPSHVLYIELATRITTQRLHYRSGDEETAARSIHSLFHTTRELMVAHPADRTFQTNALELLNRILRPYTSRWHGWMTQDGDKVDKDGKPFLKLRDEWVRRKFRKELRELQPLLLGAQKTFKALAMGETPDKRWLDSPKGSEAYLELQKEIESVNRLTWSNKPLPSLIRPQIPLHGANADGKNLDEVITSAILSTEHKRIRARREAMERKNSDSGVDDAFGLALSGGGIRSATFCLGVVQSLHKRGLFSQVDYLSTVSGGGYLGTFLTSYLGHEASPGDGKTRTNPKERLKEVLGPSFDQRAGMPSGKSAEPPPLRHLRNNSKYLLNGGNRALLNIAAVFLNGLFAAFLILLSLPLILAWIVRIFKEIGLHIPDQFPDFLHPVVKWLPESMETLAIFQRPGGGLLAFLLILCGVFMLLRPIIQRFAEGKPWTSRWVTLRKFVESAGNSAAVAVILSAAFSGSYIWVENYEGWREDLSKSAAYPPLSEWITGAISAVIPTILGLLAKRKDGTQRKWAKMLFLLTGPIFFLTTFTIIASHIGVGNKGENFSTWAAVSILLGFWVYYALNINTFSLHRYYRDRLCECYLAVPQPTEIGLIEREIESIVHGTCPERHRSATDVGTVKSSPLSEAGKSPAAPYHIINTVLNAHASHNPELRGRNGDFFIFSRDYCGSPLTGYITTEKMQQANPGIDLGTAMAISGAAASINMGSKTMREYRFLMTLFNIRLGYWMRRPGRPDPMKPMGKLLRNVRTLFSGPGPKYFLREMVGVLHERTKYINLSDGGHIENLAVYELLRRQCKFIVCVDAGMEPGMECADLMRLQRLAEIDFGIRMHFDINDLTLLPTKYSRAYGVLVKIDYAPERAADGRETSDELGWMLYLKLALTGTEPRHVLDYRRQNPAFPHQTTGDQFYDEAQFESYRSLGHCAASNLFREEVIGPENVGKEMEVEQWFERLAGSLLADNDEVFT